MPQHEIKSDPDAQNRFVSSAIQSTVGATDSNADVACSISTTNSLYRASKEPPQSSSGGRKSTLSSLLLREEVDRVAIRSVVRVHGYLQQALRELERAKGMQRDCPPEQSIPNARRVVLLQSLLRRALGEISEPKSGIYAAVLGLEACVAELLVVVGDWLRSLDGGTHDEALERVLQAIQALAQSCVSDVDVVLPMVET